ARTIAAEEVELIVEPQRRAGLRDEVAAQRFVEALQIVRAKILTNMTHRRIGADVRPDCATRLLHASLRATQTCLGRCKSRRIGQRFLDQRSELRIAVAFPPAIRWPSSLTAGKAQRRLESCCALHHWPRPEIGRRDAGVEREAGACQQSQL